MNKMGNQSETLEPIEKTAKECDNVKAMQYERTRMDRPCIRLILCLMCKRYKENYFAYTLALLSEFVTFNINKKEKNCSLSSASMYIYVSRLMKIFNVSWFGECLDILDRLQEMGVLEYEAEKYPVIGKELRIFIKMKRFTQFMASNTQDLESSAYQNQRYNINHFRGYFWVPVQALVDFFFKKQHYAHGIKDLALLLYFNSIYQDDLFACDALKNCRVSAFGVTCGELKSEKERMVVRQNLYFRQSDLAELMGIPKSALKNMLARLVREGIIASKYIRNKGTCVVIRYKADNEWLTDEEANNALKALEGYVYDLEEPRIKPKRGAESFTAVRMFAKEAIRYLQEFYRSLKNSKKRRNRLKYVWLETDCLPEDFPFEFSDDNSYTETKQQRGALLPFKKRGVPADEPSKNCLPRAVGDGISSFSNRKEQDTFELLYADLPF